MFTKIVFDRFTAFQKADINFSPGINVLIGENGTGKTHVLKSLYAAADVSVTKKSFAEKLTKVFLPSKEHINRLVKRGVGRGSGSLEVFRRIGTEELRLRLSINSWEDSYLKATLSGHKKTWFEHPVHSVYIPVKEMLANAPGFKSLYDTRNVHFEEVYADIITKALLPPLRGPSDAAKKKITNILQKAIDGKITVQKEEFFLRNKQGNLEFTLLAEGFRKLGLLWTLLQNGTLLNGSVLFWDEPESNLNPKLIKILIEVLIELQRMGVQVFISTHNYTVLKEFDLQLKPADKVCYHSLYRNPKTNEIEVNSTEQYDQIDPNMILDTFTDMYDREISRSY
jgi:predicted ATPase